MYLDGKQMDFIQISASDLLIQLKANMGHTYRISTESLKIDRITYRTQHFWFNNDFHYMY